MRSLIALTALSSLTSACSGGQTSIGANDMGLGSGGVSAGVGASAGMSASAGAGANGGAGGGGMAGTGGAEPCLWSGDSGLVAEWRANGNLNNEVPCSPFQAELLGQVDYGPGREAEAWQIRSTWTMVDGGDENYVNLLRNQDIALGQITVDVWIQQTAFNDYNNSNRLVFSTSYRPQPDMLPGEAQLYLHENKNYLAFIKTGSGSLVDEDWAGCDFPTLGPSETLAPLDTWLRLSFSYDGSSIRCYLNGALDSEMLLAAKEPASVDLLPLIGRNYPGDVDALRVFNRALAADELAVPWP